MSESRYSSESRSYCPYSSRSSESRGSESRTTSYNSTPRTNKNKDSIDELIDNFKKGRITGNELADRIDEINKGDR